MNTYNERLAYYNAESKILKNLPMIWNQQLLINVAYQKRRINQFVRD